MCDQHLTDEEREHRPGGPVALVDEVVVALTNGRIYAPEHPRMKSSISSLHDALRRILKASGHQTIRIGAADGFLFHDQRPLLGATLSSKRLLEPLSNLDSGGLSFALHATPEDLLTFIRFLGREVGKVEHFREANKALDQQGCRTIRFLPPFCAASGSWTDVVEARLASDDASGAGRGSGGGGSRGNGSGGSSADGNDSADGNGGGDGGGNGPGDGDGDGDGSGGGAGPLHLGGPGTGLDLDFNVPMRLHQDAVQVLQDAMLSACRGNNVDTSSAAGTVESILTRLSLDPGAMLGQARYEKYDAFTFGHSIRVCYLALNFARHLTSDAQMLERIGLAALMHDIGKARVPFDILHSSARLSPAERLEMNMHTVHGGQILLESGAQDPLAVAVAFSHHQNQDGSGYPGGIRGGTPSPATNIIKLADVYEALTAVRPYKPRMSPVRAYRIMIDMKENFDPALLRRFIEVNGIHPVGSHVRLSTGEIARVDELTEAPKEPIVTPIVDEQGVALGASATEPLDLREVFGRNKISITEHVLDHAA